MNWLHFTVGDFHQKRKCFSISGCLVILLLVFITQSVCRPPTDDETTSTFEEDFNLGEEYTDVDNVEFHHVKVIDGIMHEDHPVVMYKEDFVSEDYDPDKKNGTAVGNTAEATHGTHPHRRYKSTNMLRRRHRLNHTDVEKYHPIKPEKVLFDVLPQEPVMEDTSANDLKFDASKIRVEVIPLDNNAEEEEEPSKQILSKRPKKYRRRSRRDTDEHVVQKRNPYYRIGSLDNVNDNSLTSGNDYYPAPSVYGPPYQTYKPHPIPGNLWNAIHLPVKPAEAIPLSIGFRAGSFVNDVPDRVIWGRRRVSTNAVAPAARPTTSIFHDSNPENADTSFMGRRTTSTTRAPPVASRPTTSIFHNSNPEDADLSFFTRRPVVQQQEQGPQAAPINPTTTTRSPPVNQRQPDVPTNEATVSDCVWAIVNCCSSRDANVRYYCFADQGCDKSFFDLNPCADNVRDRFVDYVGQVFG